MDFEYHYTDKVNSDIHFSHFHPIRYEEPYLNRGFDNF